MNEKRLIEANTRLVDEIRGLKYDITMLENKLTMNNNMKDLYLKLKQTKDMPMLSCYVLSNDELSILIEQLDKLKSN